MAITILIWKSRYDNIKTTCPRFLDVGRQIFMAAQEPYSNTEISSFKESDERRISSTNAKCQNSSVCGEQRDGHHLSPDNCNDVAPFPTDVDPVSTLPHKLAIETCAILVRYLYYIRYVQGNTQAIILLMNTTLPRFLCTSSVNQTRLIWSTPANSRHNSTQQTSRLALVAWRIKPDTSSSISEDFAWILICWCLFWFGSCRSLGSERSSTSPTTDSLQRWPAPETFSTTFWPFYTLHLRLVPWWDLSQSNTALLWLSKTRTS